MGEGEELVKEAGVSVGERLSEAPSRNWNRVEEREMAKFVVMGQRVEMAESSRLEAARPTVTMGVDQVSLLV